MLRLVYIFLVLKAILRGLRKITVENWDDVTYSTANLLVFLVSDERIEILQSYAGGKKSP